jgi:serine/threonine protein kinase HipA of HipAB toxin-antitoxin module
MDLLLGSERAYEDRKMFMTANLLCWMLGAIDGHAKNFSIFLRPGSRFHLTPLYDVISIYPVVASHQIALPKVKMAMSVLGKTAITGGTRLLGDTGWIRQENAVLPNRKWKQSLKNAVT